MVKKKHDYIIVMDLEATCEKREVGVTPVITEITEFGMALFNPHSGFPRKGESIYVNNRQAVISQYCIDLTGITQELLDEKGIPFAAACNKIVRDYGSRARAWASWGDYDRIKVEQECALMHVPYPFSVRHINLKELFAIKYKLKKGCGMARALEFCGLELLGKHHCGADDAYNTARLIPYILGDKIPEALQ